MIWIDGCEQLNRRVVMKLREISDVLLHFSERNIRNYQERNFSRAGRLYDFHVVTDPPLMALYRKTFPYSRIITEPPGYDPTYFTASRPFSERANSVLVVSEYSKELGKLILDLIEARIPVRIAGSGWLTFLKAHTGDAFVSFIEEKPDIDSYATLLSGSRFVLEWGAETLEPQVPSRIACEAVMSGAVLIKKRSDEAVDFFSESEAVFYDGIPGLVGKLSRLRSRPEDAFRIAKGGWASVATEHLSIPQSMERILEQIQYAFLGSSENECPRKSAGVLK
ncbi:MAG: glycosyltransferase [Verrucomicrobiales bacterium]|nr:glycosyltransferase [Verrucomicrobiales bacterium]